MAITMKSINNNMMKGFAANCALRDALVRELYKETVVIRKFEITKDAAIQVEIKDFEQYELDW